jgi:hypothetical protein
MERDIKDSIGQAGPNAVVRFNALIKIKDHEGNSAFDVYNASIARRALRPEQLAAFTQINEEVDDMDDGDRSDLNASVAINGVDADEVFAFGSNKNLTLGFGDGDDRQHPEKIQLKRPDHLIFRFHHEYLQSKPYSGVLGTDTPEAGWTFVSDLPILVRNRPIIIQDVALAKLHSAILTTDPEYNLYVCGFGPGGRLGTGDEETRFNYVCLDGGALAGKKIASVALGQNHYRVRAKCSLGVPIRGVSLGIPFRDPFCKTKNQLTVLHARSLDLLNEN